MKATAFCVAVAMTAAAPALAQDKPAQDKPPQAKAHTKAHAKKAAAKPVEVEEPLHPVDSNEASWRLLKGASWLVLPSWSLPIVMPLKKDMDEKEAKEQAAKATAGRK